MSGRGVLPGGPGAGEVLDRDDDRRVGDDPEFAVDDVGAPGQHAGAVPGPGLRHHVLVCAGLALADALDGDLLADQLQQLAGLQVLVPGLQAAHPGGAPHPVPVLAHAGHDDRAPVRRGEPAVAAHDLEAGREPLDVPLPRTGQRLVEVVDVEQHPPLRGAEQAEVRQMGVAAQLHGDAGPGRAGQVGGHDRGRAPEERERRHEHPAVPDRDEFGHPRPGLLFEQRDRVGTVRRRLPPAVAGPRGVPTGRPAARDPVLDGQPLPPPGRRETRLRSGRAVRGDRIRARTDGHRCLRSVWGGRPGGPAGPDTIVGNLSRAVVIPTG